MATTTSTGRQYSEHNGVSSSNTFTVQWMAPPVGTGSVTMYYAGIGANGNGQNSGDGAAKNTFTMNEGTASSIFNPKSDFDLKLYPNPASGMLHVRAVGMTGEVRAEIFDMLGRQVMMATFGDASRILDMDVSGLMNGNYSIRVIQGNKTATYPFLKY